MPNFLQKMFAIQAPSITPAAAPAAPYDIWGNIKAPPERRIEEIHGKNFIKIFIYKVDNLFFFGFQFRIERLIKEKTANINGQPYETPDAARIAAREELKKIIFKAKSRGIKMQFADFVKIYYNQPELF